MNDFRTMICTKLFFAFQQLIQKGGFPAAIMAGATFSCLPQATADTEIDRTAVLASVQEPTDPLVALSRRLQPRCVKLYGAGRYAGLETYQSGFFVSDQGHIVTSWSTVLDVTELNVVTSDGRVHIGQVVGTDPAAEIALVKIELEGTDFFELKEPVPVAAGQRVLAISNLFAIAAYGEACSLLKGVIMTRANLSARRGRLKTIYAGEVLVLDAMTNNPGATGGVLVNLRGQAIGMLGKELRDEGAGIFMNYALPREVVAESVGKMLRGETIVARAESIPADPDPHSLADLGVVLVPDVLDKTPAFVDRILPDSAAAKAGLEVNDLVLLLDGQRVDSQRRMRELLTAINRNDRFQLLVQRGQSLISIDVEP